MISNRFIKMSLVLYLTSFVLAEETEVEPVFAGCASPDGTTKCSACNDGYWDTTESMCVDAETTVTNALFYSADGKASACKPGFYLAADKCEAVPTTATNCSTGTMSGTTFTCSLCMSKSK